MRSDLGQQNSRKHLWKTAGTILLLANFVWLIACQGVSTGGSGQQQIGSLSIASSLSFGSVPVGTSETLAATATNSGSAPVTLRGVVISTNYFSITGPVFPVTIAAGQSVPLSIEFTPNAAGTFNATATIASDASDSSVALPLSGTGVTDGQLAVSPTTLGIGNVVVGASGTASGTLTASGASITITAASTNNSVFSVGGLALPVTIPAGQSTSYTVTFSPQTTGAASASLTFTSNAQSSSTTEALTGTGTAPPTHQVSLSWNASSSSGISGYNVYRAVCANTSCGSFSKINSVLNTTTLYTDPTVADGSAYCYATTAVNSSSQESGYSNIVTNIQIPPP